jgi:hypothetical protein
MTTIETTDLTGYFDNIFEKDGLDPELFTDMDSRLDPMFYGAGDALGYAVSYVIGLEIAQQQDLAARSICDPQAFRYYAELSRSLVHHAPYTNEILVAQYWTCVSIVLAQLYHYVRRNHEARAQAVSAAAKQQVSEVEDVPYSLDCGARSSR